MEKETPTFEKAGLSTQDFLNFEARDFTDLKETRKDIFRRLSNICKEINLFNQLTPALFLDPEEFFATRGKKTVSAGYRAIHKQRLKSLLPHPSRGKKMTIKNFSAIQFTPKFMQMFEPNKPPATPTGQTDQGVRLTVQPGAETSHFSHIYDDRAPLCASPLDPSVPAYIPATVENIWCALQLTAPVAAKIKADMSEFLHMTPDQRFDYFQTYSVVRRVTEQDCEHDQCDPGLIGQKGLFITKDLPAFTVLGVYAGVFLRNQKELDYLSALHGKKNISDYMFRICQVRLWPKLSAFRHGSRLSTVNSASDYCDGLHAGLQTVVKRMNAAVFYARTSECPFPEIRASSESPDLVFFVTCRDVKKGEQALTDYGPVYWAND